MKQLSFNRFPKADSAARRSPLAARRSPLAARKLSKLSKPYGFAIPHPS